LRPLIFLGGKPGSEIGHVPRVNSAKFWSDGLVILERKVAGVSAGSLERFVRRARRVTGLRGAVNVLLTTSAAVRRLNRRFRRKDKATDVLSFPAMLLESSDRKRSALAGDIVISADVAAESAVALGHSPSEEVRILALHGILHLAGFDHERDNGEMARREAKLRRMLALPESLIERAQPARRASSARHRDTPRRKGRRRLA
jgi:probable rRNA maturation factor